MKIKFLLFFCLYSLFCLSQPKPGASTVKTIGKPISADCKKAIPILLNNSFTYGVTPPPKGFGEIQEFKTNNSATFEGEHNSAWYLLSIGKDGGLIFDIIPFDTTNDYDFLLYKYTDSTFCDQLLKNKLKPVRSNLSNIKKSKKGITGLKPDIHKNAVGEGIGESYSSSINVKKGEKYMLILDNVTPEGKGHTIRFNFMKKVEIKGKIINSDSVPVVADITLSDNFGNTVEETKSNAKGEYKINTEIKENQNYNLTFLEEGTFVQTATINTKDLKEDAAFPDIKTMLPKLKKGEKYKLGNINFYGNKAILLPESIPSEEALYKLMKKNKKMTIQIQGHTNGEDWHLAPENQSPEEKILSEDRAKTIYNYLVAKGIAADRMSTYGFGSTKAIYKNPKDEGEQSANRRVEIKVLSFE
ncbi:MAG: OmpA family protein [Bacteroidia bacterium]